MKAFLTITIWISWGMIGIGLIGWAISYMYTRTNLLLMWREIKEFFKELPWGLTMAFIGYLIMMASLVIASFLGYT